MMFLVIFVVGAIAGTLYDYIHVYFGVLSYTTPHFAGTSLWVPLEFGLAAVLSSVPALYLSKFLRAPRITKKRLAFDAFLLALGYVFTGVLMGKSEITLAVLALLSVIAVGTRLSKYVVVACLIGAVAGPLGEACVSSTGFFHYNFTSIIPYWLPLLWVIATGLFIDVPLAFAQRSSPRPFA